VRLPEGSKRRQRWPTSRGFCVAWGIFLITTQFMLGSKNLLYYSANSYLSYIINKQFYGGQHYVWCSPIFNPSSLDRLDPLRNIAPSSSPHDIYLSYKRDAGGSDTHSSIIRQNRNGIKRGAKIMLAKGQITTNEYQIIIEFVKRAQLNDFRPLLYLIPAPMVAGRVQLVSPKDAANPLGREYKIFDLKEGEFELLEFIN
jgi:hypothetical protein